MSRRFPLILSILAVIVAAGTLVYTTVFDDRGKHLVTWNVYSGELQTENATYNVAIDEDDHGYGFRRLVHLYPVGTLGYSCITGHDYDGDGEWNRVFYCGEHEMVGYHPNGEGWGFGCNSVLRTRTGWKFEPCPADEGVVQPFSDDAIRFAVAELDAAMTHVHTESNLDERWEWNANLRKTIKVFDRNAA